MASDAMSTLSNVSSTNQSTIQMGGSLMSTSMQISSSVMTAVSALASSLASAQSQIAAIANQASGYNWDPDFASVGAILPGYGGGDIVPFMLEPGEAVVRKEAVRSLGASFFSQLNSTPNISAGLIGGALGLDSSTAQSTTNVSSGYNINIQVAPDASLSTIERNIDKIANGVRQVFEEYL